MIEIAIHKTLKTGHAHQELDVKLNVEQGIVTSISGPSGSGKSTFLKIVAGLITPESGHVIVNGKTWLDTQRGINLAPQHRKAGLVFQNYALFPNMTVRQHLQYATKHHAWIDELLQIGGLDLLQDRRPEYLSGGQQQRLAILRAMTIKPQLLLMDEPFSALDSKTRQQLIADLQQVWRQLNTTVLIVTHQPEELNGLASSKLNIGG